MDTRKPRGTPTGWAGHVTKAQVSRAQLERKKAGRSLWVTRVGDLGVEERSKPWYSFEPFVDSDSLWVQIGRAGCWQLL